MSRIDIISIAAVMGGITLFFIDKLSPGNLFGNFTAVLSGIAFAWLILLLRKQKDASPIESIILGNLFTAIIGIPFMFTSLPSLESCAGLLMLGIFQLGVSYILYTNAIKHVTAIEGVLIPVIEPLLNPLWVLIFLHEKPGFWPIIGGIIVLLSITFRSIFTLKRRYLPV
jgi:drug/metabolite transporter (DMT)-like permease